MRKSSMLDTKQVEELLLILRQYSPDSVEATDAFGKLCKQYNNLLDSMVRRFAPSLGIGFHGDISPHLGIGIEELRQDAVMALYKAACAYIPSEEGKGANVSFGLYAKICIRNAMISQVRRAERMQKKRIAGTKEIEDKTRFSLPEDAFEAGETMRLIQSCLSPYEKTILPLYITGKPPREIAVQLGKSEKSVSNAIYRIKVKIRGLLERK